ncbi:MAG: hypothetical protein JWO37_2693 [Acidimicrobiales bacterium]|nr:hypothetical protein [Acidimicrobiales bacterium]
MWRALTAAGLVGLAIAGPAGTPSARASVPVLVIDGRGFGHGVGMAQDGALWMGVGGANLGQILGHFYPGTSLGKASGAVRVAVMRSPSGDAVLQFPDGGQVRDAPSGPQSAGFPLDVPAGGQARVWWDGSQYHAQLVGGPRPYGATMRASSGTNKIEIPLPTTTTAGGPANPTTTTSPPTPTLVPPTAPGPRTTTTTTSPPPASGGPPPPEAVTPRPLWATPANYGTVAVTARGRRYRGLTEAIADGSQLRLVNQLDVEDYLRGMGEVRDPSWPAASLQTQAVAARTYALRAMRAGGEICDDDRCQVYLGAQAEYPAMDKAVAATRGAVVAYGGSFASTVYSANGGGVSATTEEGFGTNSNGYPYLRAAPYTTRNPAPWRVTIALSDLAARFGVAGGVTNARVTTKGPSGRALAIALDGNGGGKAVDAHAFASGLGLHSTLFQLHVEEALVAPPPPNAGDFLQVPPDEATAQAPVVATPDTVPAPSLSPAAVPRFPAGQALGHAATTGRARNRLVILLAVVTLVLAAAITGFASLRARNARSQGGENRMA